MIPSDLHLSLPPSLSLSPLFNFFNKSSTPMIRQPRRNRPPSNGPARNPEREHVKAYRRSSFASSCLDPSRPGLSLTGIPVNVLHDDGRCHNSQSAVGQVSPRTAAPVAAKRWASRRTASARMRRRRVSETARAGLGSAYFRRGRALRRRADRSPGDDALGGSAASSSRRRVGVYAPGECRYHSENNPLRKQPVTRHGVG